MINEVDKVVKLAVLIDADNTSADLADEIFQEIAKYGIASVKRIYGDWSKESLKKWKEMLLPFAIIPIQQFAYTVGKNSTDMAMVIDAMDLLYSKTFDGFCIVSSDSDFTRLASRIRESGLKVYGFGKKQTPEALRKACDKFVFTENLRTALQFDDTDNSQQDRQIDIGGGANKNSDATQSGKQWDSKALRQDTKLISLLRRAIAEHKSETGWASLGRVGAYINNVNPDFDPRNYGYGKLSSLVRAIGLFDLAILKSGAYIKSKHSKDNVQAA